ncbi:unnamed protein product, partial [marine sediment metagenome]
LYNPIGNLLRQELKAWDKKGAKKGKITGTVVIENHWRDGYEAGRTAYFVNPGGDLATLKDAYELSYGNVVGFDKKANARVAIRVLTRDGDKAYDKEEVYDSVGRMLNQYIDATDDEGKKIGTVGIRVYYKSQNLGKRGYEEGRESYFIYEEEVVEDGKPVKKVKTTKLSEGQVVSWKDGNPLVRIDVYIKDRDESGKVKMEEGKPKYKILYSKVELYNTIGQLLSQEVPTEKYRKDKDGNKVSTIDERGKITGEKVMLDV